MQKLFSMFPNGAPGVALLLLRLFVSAILVADTVAPGMQLTPFLLGVHLACAFAIVVGVVTPIAALVAALIESIGIGAEFAQALHSSAPIVIGLALALLGPGAYSIDARLFGRRLMEFGPDANDGSGIDR